MSVTYYVYIDYTTKGKHTYQPFYVGKGVASRLDELNITARNRFHARIVKTQGLNRTIVFSSELEEAVFNVERLLIRILKTKRGEPGHWGVNLT